MKTTSYELYDFINNYVIIDNSITYIPAFKNTCKKYGSPNICNLKILKKDLFVF